MEYFVEKSKGKNSIVISGDVTIQNISGLKKIFLELLYGDEELLINNENITEFDLSYYQFLITVLTKSKELNKKIRIITNEATFNKFYMEIGVRSDCTIENIYRE